MFDDATWAALNDDWNQRKKKKQGVSGGQPVKQKKSFLLDQASTGGGIAGALGGAAGGAAIGSVVPVVGTAIGGLLGAILGGGLGSMGGEAVENVATGDNLSKNLLKEGLIGGATSLPITAGLKLARAGVKAGTGLGGRSAVDLVQEAGMQSIGRGTVKRGGRLGTQFDEAGQAAVGRLQGGRTVGVDPLKSSTQGRVQESGNRALLRQYGTIDKPTTRTSDPLGTVTDLANIGITKPVDAERIAGAITGTDGLLNKQVAKAVGGAADVDVNTLRGVFDDALDNYGLVDKDRDSLSKVFEAQMKRVSGGARGSLNPKVNPTEALTMMKSLEKRIANLQGKGGNYRLSTPEREDQASVLRLVKDELEDQIYRGAGANDNIAGLLTPELRDNLLGLMPKNQKWVQYVDDTVMKSSDIGSLRSAQAPFVRVRNMIDNADANSVGAVGRASQLANGGGIRSALMDTAANVAINPASRAYAAATRGLSGSQRPTRAVGQGLVGATARQGLSRAILNSEAPQAQPQIDPSLELDAEMTDTEMLEQPQNPTGYSSLELGQALMQALAAGDKESAKQLKDMYELAAEFEDQGAGGKMSAMASKAATQAANGENAINSLEALLMQAGGGSGTAGKFRGMLPGELDPSAKLYNDSLGGYVDMIAKARGKTDALSEADRELILNSLPKITDTPENARRKIAQLRADMQLARQNAMLYGGGAAEEPVPAY